MKKLLIILSLLSFSVFAEGPVVDPTVVSTKDLACILPTEYTNLEPMPPAEIIGLEFFRSPTNSGPWISIGFALGGLCEYTVDIANTPLGQSYYMVITNSIFGPSAPSNIVPLEVAITPVPKPAAQLGWK